MTLSQSESDRQGGKTGGKKVGLPEGRPNRESGSLGSLLQCLRRGFGSIFASDLAFSFAANSCLTLRAMASVSTL